MTPRDLLLVETDARLASETVGDDGPPSADECRDMLQSAVAAIKTTIWMKAQDNETRALRRRVDRLTDMVIEQREWIETMKANGVRNI